MLQFSGSGLRTTFLYLVSLAVMLISLFGERKVQGVYWGSSGNQDDSCRDVYRRCHVYKQNKRCEKSTLEKWMKAKCARTCGFCVVQPPECKYSKYGCCQDKITPADGPNKKGCSVKLCSDRIVCDKLTSVCDSQNEYFKNYIKENCPATCGFCAAPLPPIKKCEEQSPLYGCCWNGDPATGPRNQGCPACVDTSKYVCRLFHDKCNSKFFIERDFMEKHCPQTCGQCPAEECSDTEVKCGQWALDGLCKRPFWKHFMKKHCAKSCGHCHDDAVEH